MSPLLSIDNLQLTVDNFGIACGDVSIVHCPFSIVNCQRLALAGGGDEGIRTPDPLLAGQVLSQLSYTPSIAN